MSQLPDRVLPAAFVAADTTAVNSQRAANIAYGIRLVGAVVAAACSIATIVIWTIDPLAVLALAGFGVALFAEFFLAFARPERRWYNSRAVAESVKTLSWRFAVGADPFYPSLSSAEARRLFASRVAEVLKEQPESFDLPEGRPSQPTDEMNRLRASPFQNRRDAYLTGRTEAQRNWYARKARYNRRRAAFWRVVLICAEVVAVVLAAGRLFGGWDIDLAGLLAALVGAGAGWLSFKQHSSLHAAYSLTASELERQHAILDSTSEAEWPAAVADAEEAISREHTMWLASRGAINQT